MSAYTLPRRSSMKVSAEHLAKMAVELTGSIHVMAEHLDDGFEARWDVEAITARTAMAAIREELAALEDMIASRVPAKAEAA